MLTPAWAVILAAGRGSRLAGVTGGMAKQFLEWRGKPLYWHSALAFARSACIDGIVLVFGQEECEAEASRIASLASRDNLGIAWKVVAGGARRQDSSANGIAALPAACQAVLVHDAARCFVTPGLIRRIAETISPATPAVVPAVPVTDTIKLVARADTAKVAKSLARERLAAAQTPQGFYAPVLRELLSRPGIRDMTDDSRLFEDAGLRVQIVAGENTNHKVTNPEDLQFLRESDAYPCSGFGYDAHRFGKGRPLKLGGVAIPGSLEVMAHSDGDVLLHSLIDAIFGCACLGDIGSHFPDSDPAYAGISSALLLNLCLEKTLAAGLRICHADLTVVTQKPKLAPYSGEIWRNVARLLALPKERVNFKATTEEGMGFTGAMEGIKAFALVNGIRGG